MGRNGGCLWISLAKIWAFKQKVGFMVIQHEELRDFSRKIRMRSSAKQNRMSLSEIAIQPTKAEVQASGAGI
jgi:hypothetical protein